MGSPTITTARTNGGKQREFGSNESTVKTRKEYENNAAAIKPSNKNSNLLRRKSAAKLGSSPMGTSRVIIKPIDRKKIKFPITPSSIKGTNIEEELLKHSLNHGKKRLERM